jgi:hypothetical protein
VALRADSPKKCSTDVCCGVKNGSARVAAIAYQNKAVVYDLLFKASSQTMRTIAADPKRLGVKIGFTSVLHTWGSAMTHHPHVHMVVPGGGSPDVLSAHFVDPIAAQ